MIAIQQTLIQKLKLSLAEALLGTDAVLFARHPLTGLPSRAALDLAIQQERRPFVVGFIDIDAMKQINAAGGYDAGDAAIKTVGAILVGAVRKTDLITHWGGDEFAALLRGMCLEQAAPIVERIRAEIGACSQFSVSIGLGRSLAGAQTAQRRAKALGGNQIEKEDF